MYGSDAEAKFKSGPQRIFDEEGRIEETCNGKSVDISKRTGREDGVIYLRI